MVPLPLSVSEDRVARLCAAHGVRRLWLFGSASPGSDRAFRDDSDLDFLVEFGPLPEGSRAEAYFRLRDALHVEFGRPIDLVTVGAVENPYFAESLHATKVPVYAAA